MQVDGSNTLQDTAIASSMIDHLFRSRAGQMVSHLTRILGPEHLELAEEVVQESLLKALQHWSYNGIPDNPAGWLFRVARNAALDAVRHQSLVLDKESQVEADYLRRNEPAPEDDPRLEQRLRDDELRMVMMCCHPALAREARVALSLKTIGGFNVREIARAFLAEETTISQRLVRAKRQIRDLNLKFEMPTGAELSERLQSALEVIYLMFNEGYAAQSGEDLVRQDLCGEALRLGKLLADSSIGTPTSKALVALMAFQAARLPARVDASGDLVLLQDQNPNLWDSQLTAMGLHYFTQCSEGNEISEYHIQAAIASIHASVTKARSTDWNAILELYDQLMELNPSPIAALNRVVALSKVRGPQAGLDALRPLLHESSLKKYYLLPVVKGHLLFELGDRAAAAQQFHDALLQPCSEPERRLIQRRMAECS
ncbi:MAG TPA: sigma-70 family RNA polymerase sigma factor [Terriglobales bacterium]|nr:sigma-70 family RNA polymerase sigma factor [Terriglobales bacterium]